MPEIVNSKRTGIVLLLLLLFCPVRSNPQPCITAVVIKVIDGDTIRISGGIKVRLLGIDTPETGDKRREVQWFGKEASAYLRSGIEGKEVCLMRDRDKGINEDKYGRLLRYVFLGDVNINSELVKEGYAKVFAVQDFQYLGDFRRYESEARIHGRGLWNERKRAAWLAKKEHERSLSRTCGKRDTICASDAAGYTGKVKTVRFMVLKAHASGQKLFLDSSCDPEAPGTFAAVLAIWNFHGLGSDPAGYFENRAIDVTGKIRLYKGRPEIMVDSPHQIKPASDLQ